MNEIINKPISQKSNWMEDLQKCNKVDNSPYQHIHLTCRLAFEGKCQAMLKSLSRLFCSRLPLALKLWRCGCSLRVGFNAFSILIFIMIIQFLQGEFMSNLQTQHTIYQMELLHFSLFFSPEAQELSMNLRNGPIFLAISDPHSPVSKATEEIDSYNFETRIEPSIIIQSSSNSLHTPTIKIETENHLKKRGITHKKTAQKESRNVSSNLMRIFLKNVIELRFFDQSIGKMIERRGLDISKEEFYEWLSSFGINYKNYIRFTELRRLFQGTERRDMHAIIRGLFRSYVKGLGIAHTLTSKRIERGSNAMHLEGLRNLPIQLGII